MSMRRKNLIISSDQHRGIFGVKNVLKLFSVDFDIHMISFKDFVCMIRGIKICPL